MYFHYSSSNPLLFLPRLSTVTTYFSTVIHNLSPTGGKERQCGHFVQLRLSDLLFNPGGELIDLIVDRTALSHQLTDFSIGVHNRCVVTPPKCLANLWQ
jgi:hypothetical protein